jgi:hypothetical protein
MKSKKIWIRYLEEVEVDRPFFRHVVDVLEELGLKNDEICKTLNFGRSSFYYIKALRYGVTNKTVEFVKSACEHIHRYHGSEYSFSKDKKCFEKVVIDNDTQLLNGIYYGYFKIPHTEIIDHFILGIEDKNVRMWSKEKNGVGVLNYDKSTYSINLEAADNARNKEFLIGKNSEDPFKWLIATWRNRKHNVYSVVCLIKHIDKPAFTKWEEINSNQVIIKQDIIKCTPEEVKSLLTNDKIQFIHLDII